MCRFQAALLSALLLALPVHCQDDPGSCRRDDSLHKALGDALNQGAELYNRGDRAGCQRFFQGTLLILKARFAQDAELHKIIERALAEDEPQASVGHRAFALRSALVEVRNGVGPNPAESPRADEGSAPSAETGPAAESRPPIGQPPQQATASLDDEGRILLKIRVYKPVWVEEAREVNGQAVTVKKMKWVAEEEQRPVDLNEVQVYTAGSRKLERTRLAQLLAKERVLLTATGHLPDAAYLQFYKEDTLVLVLPVPKPLPVAPPGTAS